MNAHAQLTQVAQAASAVAQPESDFDQLLQRRFTPADLMQGDNLDRLERIADRLANGKMTVPEYLRGNPGDCMAIAMQAMLWGMDPFVVAQKTHIVNGRLGYEAQLVNAVVMASGAIRGSFRYEFHGEGPSLECRVGAVLRGESEVTWGEWIASSAVTTKNSPLWKVNPRQQMGYLQVKNWARAYCPGAILGVYTVDELEDAPRVETDAPRGPQRKSASPAPAAPASPAPEPEVPKGDSGGAPAPAAAAPVAATVAPKPASTTPVGGIAGGQVAYLRNKLKSAGVAEQAICDRFQVTGIELLNAEQFDEVKAELLANG